ncbi:MAG: transcriptional regulator [Thiobacillus sp.]|nr:transcriptional regulator [Thiobacillus sp.]
MTDRWLSVVAIAAYHGDYIVTIYAWGAKKVMPTYLVGYPWKFRRVEVDAWVKAGGANDNKTGDEV